MNYGSGWVIAIESLVMASKNTDEKKNGSMWFPVGLMANASAFVAGIVGSSPTWVFLPLNCGF